MFQVAFVHNKKENHSINCVLKKCIMHNSWRFLLTHFVDLKTHMLQSHWQCMSTQVATKEFVECGKAYLSER
jgi:hypothetical protein